MMVEDRPTSRLPPIAKIASSTDTQLLESIQYLCSLYRPQVRGSRRRRRDRFRLVSSHDEDDEEVRHDAFERTYAVRWLTALVAQLEARQKQPVDADALIQQAASLLAICAGVAASGKLHRRFTFQSPAPGGITVHVDLTDVPLDNHDYASVGAQTWGAACVLAEMIAERPDRFGLVHARSVPSQRDDLQDNIDRRTPRDRPLRVLELGAGTGLVGLTVTQLLRSSLSRDGSRSGQNTTATVVLTDFYPAVLSNLQSNIDANFPPLQTDIPETDPHPAPVRVYALPLDWSSLATTAATTSLPDLLLTPFDLVFGADIVYEAQHAVWIRDCLVSLLSHPDGSNDNPIFHLVIPLRPTHTFESATVETVFGVKGHGSRASHPELTILSKDSIVCEAYGDAGCEGSGRTDDDVEYVHYRIGWTQ